MKPAILQKLILLPALALATAGAYGQATITTIAGGGPYVAGTLGNGGPATSAFFNWPTGVAVDASGNVYITDRYNSEVRVVDGSGTVSAFAGNGTFGLLGIGGPATAAEIREPDAAYADPITGIVYFTDWFNDMAFSVDPATGTLQARCGTGEQGGDGDGGCATLARMEIPGGIATDGAGNIYIADYGNNRVRFVNTTTNVVNTFAGTGTFGYTGDGGPAAAATFQNPNGIFADKMNNIYISDAGNNVVRKVTPAGIISTVAGNGTFGYTGDGGPASAANLSGPAGLYVDNGTLYIADVYNNVIRAVNLSTGIITTVAGNGTMGFAGDGGPAIAANLYNPTGVCVDHTGALYIADAGNARIRKVAASSGSTTSVVAPAATLFAVSPNPSAGTFTLQADGDITGATADVFNVLGARVYSAAITGATTTITLDQPAGVYTLCIHTSGGTRTQKLVINK